MVLRFNRLFEAWIQFTEGRILVRIGVVMILPQVHLRKPCYDFTFL
jgi:hypothetical protein